jgi:restriction system protein
VDRPEVVPDVEGVAADQIATTIGEEFSEEAVPGADGGIDITAGRGVLGLESPRLIVQVKTGQVGSAVISQVNGLVATPRCGLRPRGDLDGASKPARCREAPAVPTQDRGTSDVIDGALRNDDALPDGIRARLPLERVWILRDE